MPKSPFTTIRVYKSDKDLLLQKYDGPAHEAVRRILTKTCTHPEEKRTYVMAMLQANHGEELQPLTQNGDKRSLGGFLCTECGTYVFRQPAPTPDTALIGN